MKNRGSTPILTNAVGVHPRNIHTKFEANPCSGLRGEVEKLKSSRRQQRQRRQRQRQRRRRRRTQPDRYSHTHSLSVTNKKDRLKNMCAMTLEVGMLADVRGAYSAISSVNLCVTGPL